MTKEKEWPKEFSLIDLEGRELKELLKIAEQFGIPDAEIEKDNKNNLIFKILEAQA